MSTPTVCIRVCVQQPNLLPSPVVENTKWVRAQDPSVRDGKGE